MRRVVLVCMVIAGGVLAAPGAAAVASSSTEFKQAVSQLGDQITALAPAGGAPAAGSAAATKLREKVAGKATPKGTPFLGPIGWLWNEIYYSIFQGNTVLMVMFGWELFLSPFIFVFCALAVFRGTAGLLKKPYVPPELRTNEP